jgi:hypothetical protein
MLAGLIALAGAVQATPAAQEAEVEASARAAIESWYAALRSGDDRAASRLLAPNAILEKPLWKCLNELSALCKPILSGDRLAVGAVRFAHELTGLTVEGGLARATVIERGWFLSSYGEYKRTALTVFFLVRNEHGAWLVAANGERGIGNLE